MTRRSAIDIAIDARTGKDTASLLAVGPLPDGVKSLLRIVADGEFRDSTTEHVYRRHGAAEIRAASATFLAAVLFRKTSDPYRVLGLPPEADADDVRENKRLLLKWLHPDRNPDPEAKAYLARVLAAAEAIENGKATHTAGERSTIKPPPIVVKPRATKTRRTKHDGLRQTALQAVDGLTHAARITLAAAAVTIVGLIAWRYVMQEPIGTSLERYSRLALGMITW